MRRSALLASLVALSGCTGSGFWRYEQDTLTLPGANPNRPVGTSENFDRSRYGQTEKQAPYPVQPGPLLTESGDIWPGLQSTVPTLKDLQKQQTAEINGAKGNGVPALAPLPPLPSLPGYDISAPEPGRPAPADVFRGSVSIGGNGRQRTAPIDQNQDYKAPPGSATTGNIVVPNGNGTSTVISPNGTVTTIPTPK